MQRRKEQIAAFGLSMGPLGLFGVPTLNDPWFVNGATGVDARQKAAQDPLKPLATIEAALDLAQPGDDIYIGPGGYDEVIVTDRTQHAGVRLIGLGGRGAVAITPSGTNDTALDQRADDFTMFNVGCAGKGTGQGLLNYGSRFRSSGSKFENDDGTGLGITLQVATVAQKAAHTHGTASDCLFDDFEVGWAATGVKLIGSDYGAVTEARFRRGRMHNLATAHFEEGHTAGGAVGVQYANLLLEDINFEKNEAGANPTKFIVLDDDNANCGMVTRCRFPVALNSALNLVSTKLLWVGNYHPAGLSTGQPS